MNMGGNSCLRVGFVSCQLITLTQQVVNPFFRFYSPKKIRKKKKTNFSINSIDLNYEKPNK